MNLTSALGKIGLTEKQVNVYLACLELGGGRVSDIARKSNIKRTTCYHVLNDLLRKGLLTKSIQKSKEYFLAQDPRTLEHRTREELAIIQTILPELTAIHNVLPYKPRITFYEGWEGAKVIYEDTITSLRTGDTILSYTGFKDFYRYMPEAWAQDYIQRRIEKKLRIKIIASESSFAKTIHERGVQELREMRIVPEKDWDFTADTQIYGNKVGIISLKENCMSVLIESKQIADMQRMAFNLMWRGASLAE